ncbi:MAG: DUF3857 domain-containing protein [Chthoniobacterales bacterium]
MPLLFRLLFLICMGGVLPALGKEMAQEAVTFSIAPAGAWVRAVTPPKSAEKPPQGDGIDYLLVDNQENVEPRQSYYHEAHAVYSENGVQNGSSISVSFDPTYQKLTLHTLTVTRKGRTMDRLDRSRIKLYQREDEMDYFLYDGTYTAQCQLEDIRVGDVIEYAYTVDGANPVLQGHYMDLFSTNWSSPVHRALARVIYPSTRKLNFQIRNKTVEPEITTTAGKTEWVWEESEIPGRQVDGSLPTGYSPLGVVQATDFASWSEVVDWALPLYEVKPPLSSELLDEIDTLRTIPDKDRRVLAALRFVQDEVRYLGIEIGPGSHQPTHPSEVLRRRFGDCKDKTQLLGTLLRAVDIEASPALVSTGLQNEVLHRLPSAAVFNHVILRVVTPSGVHWLDATRSQQRGPLSQISIGDYDYALVLRLGETELTKYSPPPASLPKTKIVEKYRIGTVGSESFLDVTSEYRGLNAERSRSYHQEHDPAELDKQYLKYYAKRFPGIQIAKPHGYAEMPGEEGCILTEHYRIPKIWELGDTPGKYSFTVHPTDLDDAMGDAVSPQRDDPLAIGHPVNIAEEIHLEMFEDWPLNSKDRQVSNAFFHFEQHPKQQGKQVNIAYSFESLTDRVAVDDLITYNAALSQAKDHVGYVLSYTVPTPPTNRTTPDITKMNWTPLLSVGFLLIGVSVVLAKLNRATIRRGPPPLPSDYLQNYHSLEGLSGWLIVLGFGICVRPIYLLVVGGQAVSQVSKLETWNQLTTPGLGAYHPLWAPWLLFELTFNGIALVASVFIAIWFFKKRAIFPRSLIIFLSYCILGALVDYLFGLNIPAAKTSLPESAKTLGQNVFGAAIWIPYLLVSQRVKETFRF